MTACGWIGVNGGAKSRSVSKNGSSEGMLHLPQKNPHKQKERRDVVTKDIRSIFGGSTIVKSSGPLN